jgi:hypothetical protein
MGTPFPLRDFLADFTLGQGFLQGFELPHIGF